jgi:hypothetical protein
VDILAIILACSLHPDDALVRTLVDAQSGDTVLFVGDLSTLTMNDGLRTTAGALRVVDQVRRRGGRPAVGLLGVPLDWAPRYGLREVDLFDACTNIAVGTAALSDYYDRCTGKSWRRSKVTVVRPRTHSPNRSAMRAARACILARFATGLGVKGTPATILKSLASSRRDEFAHHSERLPERCAIFGPESSDKTVGNQLVDASDRSMTPGGSPLTGARAKVAPTRRTPASTAVGEQLRVLPGPLPTAAAVAATRVPDGRRSR